VDFLYAGLPRSHFTLGRHRPYARNAAEPRRLTGLRRTAPLRV